MTELQIIFQQCWDRLSQASQTPGAAWRTPVLATTGNRGPRQRTVVLRMVDLGAMQLWLHTDVRSAKVQQLIAHSVASLLFYDSVTETQLQVRGQAVIQTTGPQWQQLWNNSPETSLRMYLAPQVPGSPAAAATSNLPDSVASRIPSREELADGLRNFAAVKIQAEQIEWLQLSRGGHRRAAFDIADGQLQHATWLEP
jgi:pyridoxine/pyridoxamine 5'-phosphate oxidase